MATSKISDNRQHCGVTVYLLAALVCSLIASSLLPSTASAQPADLEERLDASLAESEEMYETLDLEIAIQILVEAIELAESEDYQGSVLARLYLMLGIVESALTDDEDMVLDYFIAGLAIDRTAELNPYYATPSLRQLLDRAREMLPEEVAEPEPPEDRQPPPEATEGLMSHEPVVTVREGEPVSIVVSVNPGADIRRVLLSYRSDEDIRFNQRELNEVRSGEFFGEIPHDATQQGIQVEYYIEALGSTNQRLEMTGSPANPHAVVILHEGDGGRPRSERIVTICAGPGTGGGLATGEPMTMGDQVDLNPGVAITPVHFYLDATFALGAGIEFGPFLRMQTVLLTDAVELEFILGGKLKWFFWDGESLRMYLSFGAGWGNVRHTVDLKPTIDFVDTTQEGPYHGGIGFGVAYMFNKHVGLVGDLYSMVLFDQVSVQLDLNAGILVSF